MYFLYYFRLNLKFMFCNIHRTAVNKVLNDKEMLEKKYDITINVLVEGKFFLQKLIFYSWKILCII